MCSHAKTTLKSDGEMFSPAQYNTYVGNTWSQL